jgi:glycosyltransferase involved in cell wall biosynthesis
LNPLVTIVIPTYNRLLLVQQAIASVVAQTYTNWELIIADDGSDDRTSEMIIAMNDSRIKVVTLVHSGNIAALRNMAVSKGKGEWLAFLDSDDIWMPGKLEIQLFFLLQEKKRWGYGGYELMNNEMQVIPAKAGKYRPISGWIIEDVLSTEASVNIGTLMVERTLFEEVGGFNMSAELLYREDYELVIRLSLKSEAVAVSELLMRVREHAGRATNAFGYGNDRTVAVYEYFIRTNPEKHLAKIATRRLASELAESAIIRIRKKEYLKAIKRLGKALKYGDGARHLLSVIRRGLIKQSHIRLTN